MLESEGEFRIVDPQLDRPLTLKDDYDAVITKYAQGVAFTDQLASDATKPSRPKKSWWKIW